MPSVCYRPPACFVCTVTDILLHLITEEAFGSQPKSLGIIIVRDLPPEYPVYRERLLKLAYRFAQLPEDIREKYAHPASRYRYVNHPPGLRFDGSTLHA